MLIKTRTNVYDFNFHLVWVTKYRKKVFTDPKLVEDIKNILIDIAKNNGVEIQNLEILPEHIHMLISFPPNKMPSSVVKSFKGASARAWFKKHPESKNLLWKGHLWSPSFYMSTLGSMSKETVANYINNQIKNYK